MSTARTSTPSRRILETTALPMPLPAPVTTPRRRRNGDLILETPSSHPAFRRTSARAFPRSCPIGRLDAPLPLSPADGKAVSSRANYIETSSKRASTFLAGFACCAGEAARLWIAATNVFRSAQKTIDCVFETVVEPIDKGCDGDSPCWEGTPRWPKYPSSTLTFTCTT